MAQTGQGFVSGRGLPVLSGWAASRGGRVGSENMFTPPPTFRVEDHLTQFSGIEPQSGQQQAWVS